jgi:hypothetical protein
VGGRHLEYSSTQEKYSLCGLPWHSGCGDGKTKAKDSRGCASDAARSVGVAFRPRDKMIFMAISPFSDQLKFGGNSGLAVASSANGASWNWVSWVLHPEDVPARYNKQLEVGAGEQTLGFLSDGRMVVVSRICSCSNIKPPDTQHFKCTNSSNFCDYGVLFSLDDTGEHWSGLELLAGAGSVAPSLQRFGTLLILAGGRRGQFLWDISNGTVSAAVDLRTLHNNAVHAHNLSLDTFFQQQEPSPYPLDNGESTSYTSLLKLSETEGIVVYDMLSRNWAGPPGNGRPGPAYEGGRREDHVFSMRFHVAADRYNRADGASNRRSALQGTDMDTDVIRIKSDDSNVIWQVEPPTAKVALNGTRHGRVSTMSIAMMRGHWQIVIAANVVGVELHDIVEHLHHRNSSVPLCAPVRRINNTAMVDFNPQATPGTTPHQTALGWDSLGLLNGGGYLFYPGERGPLSSIRLEGIRDGIDWSLFTMLGVTPDGPTSRAADLLTQLVAAGAPSEVDGNKSELDEDDWELMEHLRRQAPRRAMATKTDDAWSGPQVRVVKGDGMPSFSLTNATGHIQKIPALWLVGGNPSLYFSSQPNKLEGPIALERFSREAKAANMVGVRILSFVLSFVGDNYVVPHPEILANGTLGPGVLTFLKTQLLALPDSLLILRFRLDHTFSKNTGHVMLQSALNDTDIISDWTASPTQKWAAQMGQAIVKVMKTVDAAFPGRLLGAQTLHGCTYEGNYAGSWYWRMEGKPAGYGANSYPDYSPDAKAEFCSKWSSSTRNPATTAAACIVPTAAQRSIPTLGNTLLTADSSAIAAASIVYERYINVAMAKAIATVGGTIHKASGGKAFVTTLYGGFLNGPITAGGAMALTELNQQPGMDGIGNPSVYNADSRSDLGTMQPQGPWDSPGVHGKTYVVEYDLRTYLTSCGVSCYNFLATAEETADLILHDFAAATIRGHALYFLDPKASSFVDAKSNASDPGNSTTRIWDMVETAMQTASLYKQSGTAEALTAEVGVFVDDISTAHWPVNLGSDSCAAPPPPPPPAGEEQDPKNSSWRVGESSEGCYSWPGLVLGNVGGTFGSLPFPVRYYLLSDLLVGNFSSLKLAIFLNPVRVSDDLAAAIKTKLQVHGKTIVYVDAVAAVDGDGKLSDAGRVQTLTGLTGLTKGPDTKQQIRTTTFVDPASVWPAAAQSAWKLLIGKTAGGRWPATPWFYYNVSVSTASEALVLGHYEGTNLPSLVQVNLKSHTAVYSANPALPTSAYLALALAAGVNNYTAYDTRQKYVRVEAGGNMLVIHRPMKGNGSEADPSLTSRYCDVGLPRPMTVHAANGSLICTKCARFRDCGIGRRTQVYILT